MSSKKNIPAIRFTGFDGEWEIKQLNEVAIFNPKSELPTSFNYVDLESVVGTEMTSYRTEHKESAPSRAQRLAKRGDVFYQTVRPYQKNNYLFDIDSSNFVFSTGYAQIRPLYDSGFIFSFIQRDKFVKAVLDKCTGTSYPAINSQDLAELQICLPILEQTNEQKLISNYFKNIDHLITQSTKRLEKLKNLKKAYLEKMFPRGGATTPELRFKGFSEDWQKKYLGEISPLRGGFAFASENYCDFGIPIVRISNINSDGSIGGDFIYYKENVDDLNYSLTKGSVLLAMSGATTGKVAVLDCSNKHYQNQRVGYFSRLENIDYTFIAILVKSHLFIKQLQSVLVAGAQPNVSSKDIDNFIFYIPKDKDEQQKIGNFFRNIDEQIAKQTEKLDKLKNIKKACLDKMFV